MNINAQSEQWFRNQKAAGKSFFKKNGKGNKVRKLDEALTDIKWSLGTKRVWWSGKYYEFKASDIKTYLHLMTTFWPFYLCSSD